MNKAICLFILAFCYFPIQVTASNVRSHSYTESTNADVVIKYVYKQAQLDNIMDFQVFAKGYTAYAATKDRKKSILTIIDYSRPSTEKRFFVIDLKTNTLLYHTYVTHGVNSGGRVANRFSNIVSSRQT